jgi:hypothetical protein
LLVDEDDHVEVTRGKGRSEVFPASGSKLGPWTASGTPMGTALHLRNGRRRFVLGGQQHRAPAGVRLHAKPPLNVDAWMPAQDFDALLGLVYRQHSLLEGWELLRTAACASLRARSASTR